MAAVLTRAIAGECVCSASARRWSCTYGPALLWWRGTRSAAAQTARDFLEQVQGRMEDRGSTFKSASRELAYA